MLSIYHKSNCSTSLSVLKIIRDAGIEVKIIDYLDKPLDLIALQQLQEKLKVPAEKMLRKKEKIFQEKYAHKKTQWIGHTKINCKAPHPTRKTNFGERKKSNHCKTNRNNSPIYCLSFS